MKISPRISLGLGSLLLALAIFAGLLPAYTIEALVAPATSTLFARASVTPAPTQPAASTPTSQPTLLPPSTVAPSTTALPSAEPYIATEGPYVGIPQSRTEDGAFVLGDSSAPLTIISFVDFYCPHCQAYEATLQEFITEYVVTGRARYEFRMFPTAGGEVMYYTGTIATCLEAQRPGAFWEAHDRIFEQTIRGRSDSRIIQDVVQQMELDFDEALSCAQTEDRVAADMQLGRRLQVSGTPAIRVRYGESRATSIVIGDITFDRGGLELSLLAAAVEFAETGDMPALPTIAPTTRPGDIAFAGAGIS